MAAPMHHLLLKKLFNNCCQHIKPCLQVIPQYLLQSRLSSSSTRELKRFYKNATISQFEGWYEINLDQRKLRTPKGNLFKVPNEELALAVATEWNRQKKLIQRHSMHLTSLCNTALDNPMHKTRKTLISSIIHFLETDTVSYRINEPEDLAELLHNEWDPVIQWVEQRYDIEVPVSADIVTCPDLPQYTIDTLTRHLHSYSDWSLFGYSYAVDAVKSLVLTLALMDKYISVEKAVALSRLEQEFQTQNWGTVEWYHDIDVLELRSRLSAADIVTCPDLPQYTIDTLTRHLHSYSDWSLFGYSYAVDAVKSLVLTLALMDKYISVEKAVALSRLEQEFQTQNWGTVEWYHDIDVLELRSRLSAAALFVHWCNETQQIKKKSTLAVAN